MKMSSWPFLPVVLFAWSVPTTSLSGQTTSGSLLHELIDQVGNVSVGTRSEREYRAASRAYKAILERMEQALSAGSSEPLGATGYGQASE